MEIRNVLKLSNSNFKILLSIPFIKRVQNNHGVKNILNHITV